MLWRICLCVLIHCEATGSKPWPEKQKGPRSFQTLGATVRD